MTSILKHTSSLDHDPFRFQVPAKWCDSEKWVPPMVDTYQNTAIFHFHDYWRKSMHQ